MKQVKWEIELNVPKGKIKTFVYSENGTNIVDRFKPEYECKVLGIMKENDEKEKKQIRKKIRRIQSHNGVDKNYLTSCDNRITNYNLNESDIMKKTLIALMMIFSTEAVANYSEIEKAVKNTEWKYVKCEKFKLQQELEGLNGPRCKKLWIEWVKEELDIDE